MATKKSKPVDAIRRLTFATPSTSAGGTTISYIDLGQALSRVNRRMYRQGMDYHISKIEINTTVVDNRNAINISAMLPNWVGCNAWKKGRSVWDSIQKKSMREANVSGTAKYRDFKVYLDDQHVVQTANLNLNPILSNGTSFLAGEWDMSTVDVMDSAGANTQFFLKWVGGNSATAKSLVQGYEDSRAIVPTSEPLDSEPEGSWYADIADFGAVNAETIDAVTDENDSPPYSTAGLAGGATNANGLHAVGLRLLGSPQNGTTTIGGFVACGGLLKLEHFVNTESISHNLSITVHLREGSYKGVHATPIGGH